MPVGSPPDVWPTRAVNQSAPSEVAKSGIVQPRCTHLLDIEIENVRSLAGRMKIPLAPLTIVTGENSSGKSTFLAAVAAILDPLGFPFAPGFNRPPYSLGNYDTIATYKGGKYGRAKTFSLGFAEEDGEGRSSVQATFGSRHGRPEVRRLAVTSKAGSLLLTVEHSDGAAEQAGTLQIEAQGRTEAFPVPPPRASGALNMALVEALLKSSRRDFLHRGERPDLFSYLLSLPSELKWRTSMSLAPIRSEPARTYSVLDRDFDPQGNHIPFAIERMQRTEPRSESTRVLMEELSEFGKESQLFGRLRARGLGKKGVDGEPFQIMVEMDGPPRNIIDVGYGVSQALPVLVQSIALMGSNVLLLQQPEVHLHPKAQAALGSLFARLAKKGKRFVVETHSDYFLDRVRREVGAGHLDARAVGILFFERDGNETTVHRLSLDSLGNIRNAPASYRSFFLEEEIALLQRGGLEDVSDRR